MTSSDNNLPANSTQPKVPSCDIRLLLHSLLENHKHQVLKKSLKLLSRVDEDVFGLYEIDDKELSQILDQLINNGLRYTEKGYFSIEVTCVSGSGGDDILRFTIKDSGVGMSEVRYKEVSLLLVGVVTEDSVNARGLVLVKNLLARYNSELIFSSVEGQGSEFSFDLILRRVLQPAKFPEAGINDMTGKGVLLAEDNAINALVATRLLAKWNITADHAKDGAEAIAMANTKVYSVILMDIHMPQVNGFEAVRTIKTTDNLNSSTPVYALTADVTAKDKAEFAHFFKGFLNKPIDIEKLHETLMNELRD